MQPNLLRIGADEKMLLKLHVDGAGRPAHHAQLFLVLVIDDPVLAPPEAAQLDRPFHCGAKNA